MRLGSLLLAAMLSLAPGVARAGSDDVGTTAANFLTIGAGAGILGMGGAGLGMTGGLPYASWNTASLGWLQETQFVISHAGLQDSRMQEWAAMGGRFGEGATRWSVSGLYQGEGSIEGRDAANNPTGEFNVSSIALGTQLAHVFNDRIAVGLGARFVSENLGSVTGSGFTFDGGVQARQGAFGFGLAGQNLGGQMKYEGIPYRFPGNIGAGVSYAPEGLGLRFALDANFPMSYYTDVRTGVEWMWRERVALRMGYRHEMGAGEGDQLSGPAFGLGAGVAGVWMDYGYVIEDGGGQHRIGLTLSPKSFGMHADGFGMNGSTPALDTAPPVREKAVRQDVPKPAKTRPADPAPASSAPAKVEAPKAEAPKPEPAAVKPVVESKSAEAKATSAPAAASTAIAPIVAAPKAAPVVETPKPVVPAKSEPAPAKVEPAPTKVAPAKVEPAPTKVAPAPAPAKVEPALAKLEPPPAKVEPAPTKAEPAPAKSEPAPAKVQEAPAKVAEKPAAEKPAPANKEEKPKPVKIPEVWTVRDGDTLHNIAERCNTSVAAIMMENNLVSERVKGGQKLRIPKHR